MLTAPRRPCAVTASLSELEQELEGSPLESPGRPRSSIPSFTGSRLNKPAPMDPKAAILRSSGATSHTLNKMRHDLFQDLQVRGCGAPDSPQGGGGACGRGALPRSGMLLMRTCLRPGPPGRAGRCGRWTARRTPSRGRTFPRRQRGKRRARRMRTWYGAVDLQPALCCGCALLTLLPPHSPPDPLQPALQELRAQQRHDPAHRGGARGAGARHAEEPGAGDVGGAGGEAGPAVRAAPLGCPL